MNKKIILSILSASVMTAAVFSSCSNEKKVGTISPQTEQSAAGNPAETAPAATLPPFEEMISAGSGDAYLAVADKEYSVRYCGTSEGEGSELSYDAKVAHIDGDGEYTVSVTTDTKGFRHAMTGDHTIDYTPSGCSFLAINVVDGHKLYPEMFIDVKKVMVDGKSVSIDAKDYTTSVDGVEARTNILNEWIEDGYLPSDAIDVDGKIVYNDGFSANIIDDSVFADGWHDIEVTFNVIRAK